MKIFKLSGAFIQILKEYSHTCKIIYFNSFSLANEGEFITGKDFDTLNTRFTLKEPKQICIRSVFIGKTFKEKAIRN